MRDTLPSVSAAYHVGGGGTAANDELPGQPLKEHVCEAQDFHKETEQLLCNPYCCWCKTFIAPERVDAELMECHLGTDLIRSQLSWVGQLHTKAYTTAVVLVRPKDRVKHDWVIARHMQHTADGLTCIG